MVATKDHQQRGRGRSVRYPFNRVIGLQKGRAVPQSDCALGHLSAKGRTAQLSEDKSLKSLGFLQPLHHDVGCFELFGDADVQHLQRIAR